MASGENWIHGRTVWGQFGDSRTVRHTKYTCGSSEKLRSSNDVTLCGGSNVESLKNAFA